MDEEEANAFNEKERAKSDFRRKHCSYCGSIVCKDVDDVPARDGCGYYIEEILSGGNN